MDNMMIAKVTSSGQLSLPAAVRRRWGTDRVSLKDEGDHVVVRPVPGDPIKAACGSLSARGGPTEMVRAAERRRDAVVERRRRRG